MRLMLEVADLTPSIERHSCMRLSGPWTSTHLMCCSAVASAAAIAAGRCGVAAHTQAAHRPAGCVPGHLPRVCGAAAAGTLRRCCCLPAGCLGLCARLCLALRQQEGRRIISQSWQTNQKMHGCARGSLP